MSDFINVKQTESQEKKEQEQEKYILHDLILSLERKVGYLEKSNREFENKISKEYHKSREFEQEKNLFKEFSKNNEITIRKLHKNHYISIAVIAILVSGGFVYYLHYENQPSLKSSSHLSENYKSNYVIQNLQGNTVDTWVSWNIQDGRVLRIHIVNTANLAQDKIDVIKDAILSTRTVSIDDSLNDKGPKGTSSVYYLGWQGAVAQAYSAPTKLYIPQKFDINGSPDGIGDIELILTNDVHPDGYSGYTKSLVDGNQILKSKIIIYQANRIDPSWLGAVIRHEFGHALGLGHSTANEDLMNAMIQTNYPYVSGCDVDALKGLYDGDQNSKVVCMK